MERDIAKHTPFRLSKEGYKQLCKLVDERDEGCVICRDPAVQHHHIIYRSEGGEDRFENLISLCPMHHAICGHGEDKHFWQNEFQKYMGFEIIKDFVARNHKKLERIYKLRR